MASEAEPAQELIPSIRERMATLNLGQVGRAASSQPPSYQTAVGKKGPPPPLPQRRPGTERADSVNNPPTLSNGIASRHEIGNQPARAGLTELLPPPTTTVRSSKQDNGAPRPPLPNRRPTAEPPALSPGLPPRRPSAPSRKQSTESISSVLSGKSSVSGLSLRRTSTSGSQFGGAPNESKFRVRAPEYDPATLPALPERKTKVEQNGRRPSATKRLSTASTGIPQLRHTNEAEPASPSLPPRTKTFEAAPALPVRSNSTPPVNPEPRSNGLPKRSALGFAMNQNNEIPPPLPTSRPTSASPPPIPTSSRPDLSALLATKPKAAANGTSADTCCLKCRDFSAPDSHAARFPRQSIPSTDIGWLANQLTAPFPSQTDKARAIFTWLHHNIVYDTQGFFSGNIKPSTPASTIASGQAVCEGYAGLFTALAMAAGMESVVVCGHGKGYGYDPANPPMKPDGHAWNAVRIDGGQWKLIDPCWGAGHIQCEKIDPSRSWVIKLDSSQFVMSNDEFGQRHFPEDNRYFFRDDGRPQISWDEYLSTERGGLPVQVMSDAKDEGVDERTVQPRKQDIKVNDPLAPGPTIRLQCQKICRHWSPEKHGKGKPYLFVAKLNGRDGKSEEFIPVNFDGFNWWVDLPRDKLGLPGQDLWLYKQTTYMNGQDARGLTIEEYHRTRPKWRSWGWGAIACWKLV